MSHLVCGQYHTERVGSRQETASEGGPVAAQSHLRHPGEPLYHSSVMIFEMNKYSHIVLSWIDTQVPRVVVVVVNVAIFTGMWQIVSPLSFHNVSTRLVKELIVNHTCQYLVLGY